MLLFFFRCRVEQEIPNEEKRWTGDEIWFWIAARYRRPFLSLSGWNTGGLYQHSRQVFWLGVRSVAARLIIRSIANSKAAAYFIVIFIDPFSPSLKYVSTGANYQACSSTHITTPTNAKSMLFLITPRVAMIFVFFKYFSSVCVLLLVLFCGFSTAIGKDTKTITVAMVGLDFYDTVPEGIQHAYHPARE